MVTILVIHSPYTEKLFQSYQERRMTFINMAEVTEQKKHNMYVIDDMCALDEVALVAFIEDHSQHSFIILSKNAPYYDHMSCPNVLKIISVFNEKKYIIHELFCDRHLLKVYLNFNTLGRNSWYQSFLKHMKSVNSSGYQLIIDLNPLSKLHNGTEHQLFHLRDSEVQSFIKKMPPLESHILDLRYNFKEQLNVPVDYISQLLEDLNEDYDLIYIMDGIGKPNDLKLLSRADKVFVSSQEELTLPVENALQRMCSYVYF